MANSRTSPADRTNVPGRWSGHVGRLEFVELLGGKKVNRSLLRTGVLAPLAALAVLAAAPAQARTDGDLAVAASAAPAAQPDLDLGVPRVTPRCGDIARDAGRAATTVVAGAPDAANKQVSDAIADVVADCAAVTPDPVRRLTGPATGTVFEGSAGPRGMIRERSLS
jgi:hypothetical protein